MSVRKLSARDIQEVAEILNDKESIKVLKEINENIVTREDIQKEQGGKGKGAKAEQKQELLNYVGYAKGDELSSLNGDERKIKTSLVKLQSLGLIIKGVHLDKEGNQVNKYRVTEVGSTLLGILGELGDSSGGKGNQQESVNRKLAEDAGVKTGQAPNNTGKKGNQQQEINKKLSEGKEPSGEEKPQPEQTKRNRARFPQGESSKTNGNEITLTEEKNNNLANVVKKNNKEEDQEIKSFKATQDKKLGRSAK